MTPQDLKNLNGRAFTALIQLTEILPDVAKSSQDESLEKTEKAALSNIFNHTSRMAAILTSVLEQDFSVLDLPAYTYIQSVVDEAEKSVLITNGLYETAA